MGKLSTVKEKFEGFQQTLPHVYIRNLLSFISRSLTSGLSVGVLITSLSRIDLDCESFPFKEARVDKSI